MKLLIVDDEKAVRDLLKVTLATEGFAIDSADDGARGAYLALSNEYDCIVLDNRMPKKSGIEVIQEIRGYGKKVPILVLSIQNEPRAKAELLNAGADDYLAKPYSFVELVARIRALLRRPHSLTGDVLTVDNLVLSTKSQTVQRGGTNIPLTRKEFGLLEYLLRNIGTVLTRGMLMEHVWDMEIDPFSNTVESHIASLRKKIERPASRKLIYTVSGRGYKIET